MKLTVEQGVILTGYTGIAMCKFSDLHKDIEKRVGHPVWTHQFADKEFFDKVKELYKEDFMAIMPEDLVDDG